MKKNYFYAILALCICLFASCSQEEILTETTTGGKIVNLTVGIPREASTRARPSENGYDLRCIMQLVDKDNKAITGDGMRQAVKVTAEKMTFTFTAPEGDYKCLFWADYVPTGTSVDTDNIYTTTDLTSIGYNKKDNAAFSTAADAFCGFAAGGTSTITLKRPFAKVSVTPKDAATFADYKKLTISYDAPSSFNMVTKTVGATGTQLTLTNTSFDATKGAWFSSFIFVPANASTLASDVTMKLEGGTEDAKTLTIAAGKVPLTENYEINGTFDTAEGSGDVSVDVEFDGSFDKPEVPALAIGQYLYADGTWGTNAANAIGIVFRVGKYEGDNGAYPMSTINGYAIALNDVSDKGIKWSETAFVNPTTITGMIQDVQENYDAYTYCQLTTDVSGTPFNQLPPVKAALDYNVTVDKNNTSGWYLPTSYQLKDVYDNLTTIDPKFEALGTAATKLQANIYWGCVVATSGKPLRLQFDPSATADAGNAGKASGSNSALYVRPILTF